MSCLNPCTHLNYNNNIYSLFNCDSLITTSVYKTFFENNSEVSTSEILENIEEMSHRYWMHSDSLSIIQINSNTIVCYPLQKAYLRYL